MKKSICLYFQVHQPTRLRLYRFFDIGKDSHYYDDFANRTILRRVADRCYLPMNEALLEAIKESKGAFKAAFSISGSALEQFDRYAPEVVDSFRALAQTGCVEFLAQPYYHSMASLAGEGAEFTNQVLKHKEAIESHFGVTPTSFCNTELVYSDEIGKLVYKLGFKSILTEGARHIMGWKSSNFVYSNDLQPKLKVLVRNSSMSDDIALRFSDRNWGGWPLTAEKYAGWLKSSEGEIVNLCMDYETFGELQDASTGIIDFMKDLPAAVLAAGDMEFVTPSKAATKHKATDDLSVPEPISCSGEERDVTSWLGNELQQDAFNKLYELTEKLSIIDKPEFWNDYGHLQESDHLYYMSTKFFSSSDTNSRRVNPYDTPYEAFINFMNVLSDFIIRVDDAIASK